LIADKIMEEKNKYQSRREFVRKAGKLAIVLPLAFIPVALAKKLQYQDMYGRLILLNVPSAVSVRQIVS